MAHVGEEPSLIPLDTPGQQFYHNSLILDNVLSWLPGDDLINCLLTSKSVMSEVVRALYGEPVPADLGERLTRAHCPYSRLTLYLSTVTAVRLKTPVYPTGIARKSLGDEFPALRQIVFDLPIEDVTCTLSKGSGNCFSNLVMLFTEGEHCLETALVWPEMGLVQEEGIRLTEVEVDSSYSGNLELLHRTTDPANITPGFIAAVRHLKVLDFWFDCDTLALQAVLQSTANLRRLSVDTGMGIDFQALFPVLLESCPRLRHLALSTTETWEQPRCFHALTVEPRHPVALQTMWVVLDGRAWERASSSPVHLPQSLQPYGAADPPSIPEVDGSVDMTCSLECYQQVQHINVQLNFHHIPPPNPYLYARALDRAFKRHQHIHLIGEYIASSVDPADEHGVAAYIQWAQQVVDIMASLKHEGGGTTYEPGWRKVEG